MRQYDDAFDALQAGVESCRDCEGLFGYEPHPVFQGRRTSKIMQISQAPSRRAHASGVAFDDASGKKLRQEWYEISDAVFYDPANFFIGAMGHCYPGKMKGGGDRVPPKHCREKWLARELKLVENRIYILVGGLAVKHFFPGSDLTPLVFADLEIQGKPAYVLPHPSPLNVRWFVEHPAFFEERLPVIRAAVHAALVE